MGSVDAVEPKAMPAGPAGVAVPGTPSLAAVPSTPAAPAAPGTPRAGDRVDVGTALPSLDGIQQVGSPSQQAATSLPASPKGDGDEIPEVGVPGPSERVSKKQKIEQTQEAVVQLTSLMKTTLEGLQSLHETLKLNTESQQLIKDEVEALAKQMGQDAITTKVVYSSLSEYQRTLTNAAWQLTGHKKESNVSIKEIVMHLEDYSRQISLRLLEAKNEARAQHASSITSLKEIIPQQSNR